MVIPTLFDPGKGNVTIRVGRKLRLFGCKADQGRLE